MGVEEEKQKEEKRAEGEEEEGEEEKEEEEEEEVCVSVGEPVSVVCVDQTTGHIVAAAQNNLR